MRFQKTVDIWTTPVETLQPGQWVSAGTNGPRGVFCGVRPSGVVVAWNHTRTHIKALRAYAKR